MITSENENAMLALEEKALIWDKIFTLLGLDACQPSNPISLADLINPQSKVARALLKIFSMNTFLVNAINDASRFKDGSKVATLGPFRFVLCQIFASGVYKVQISASKVLQNKGLRLFRATFLS